MGVTICAYGAQGQLDVGELNLANGNWDRLAKVLGYDDQPIALSASGQELDALRMRIDCALALIDAEPHRDAGVPDRQVPASVARGLTGQIVSALGVKGYIECGLPPGYYRERLGQLAVIVDAARQTPGGTVVCA